MYSMQHRCGAVRCRRMYSAPTAHPFFPHTLSPRHASHKLVHEPASLMMPTIPSHHLPLVFAVPQVMAAATSGNYARFFRLYTTAPNMGAYVMDYATHAMRIKALTFMARGCV